MPLFFTLFGSGAYLSRSARPRLDRGGRSPPPSSCLGSFFPGAWSRSRKSAISAAPWRRASEKKPPSDWLRPSQWRGLRSRSCLGLSFWMTNWNLRSAEKAAAVEKTSWFARWIASFTFTANSLIMPLRSSMSSASSKPPPPPAPFRVAALRSLAESLAKLRIALWDFTRRHLTGTKMCGYADCCSLSRPYSSSRRGWSGSTSSMRYASL